MDNIFQVNSTEEVNARALSLGIGLPNAMGLKKFNGGRGLLKYNQVHN